jgi:GNAT superfamily N-acetyltransferase
MEIQVLTETTAEVSDFFDRHFTAYSKKTIGKQSDYKQYVFTAHKDNKLVGALRCEIMWSVVHIDLMIVDAENQKKGVGTLLFNKVLDLNASQITVETFDFQATQYWINKGFQVDYIRDGYDGHKLYYLSKNRNQM